MAKIKTISLRLFVISSISICFIAWAENETYLFPPREERAVPSDALSISVKQLLIQPIADLIMEGRVWVSATMELHSTNETVVFDTHGNDCIYYIKINNDGFQYFAPFAELGSASYLKDWVEISKDKKFIDSVNNAIKIQCDKVESITIKLLCNIKIKGKWGEYIITSLPFKKEAITFAAQDPQEAGL